MELWDPVVIALQAELKNQNSICESEAEELYPLFRDENGELLVKAFLCLKTRKEVSLFIRDILTDKQVETCKRKLKAAYLLADNATYRFIEESTGLSSRITTRISKRSKDPNSGYSLVLAKLCPTKFSYDL